MPRWNDRSAAVRQNKYKSGISAIEQAPAGSATTTVVGDEAGAAAGLAGGSLGVGVDELGAAAGAAELGGSEELEGSELALAVAVASAVAVAVALELEALEEGSEGEEDGLDAEDGLDGSEVLGGSEELLESEELGGSEELSGALGGGSAHDSGDSAPVPGDSALEGLGQPPSARHFSSNLLKSGADRGVCSAWLGRQERAVPCSALSFAAPGVDYRSLRE